MADEPTGQTQTEPQPSGDGGRDRTPTKYHVLVEEAAGTLAPIMDGNKFAEFEGRRPDVLEEVLTGDYGVEPDEQTGKSPWCWIVPARGFQKLRGSVKVERSVVPEEG